MEGWMDGWMDGWMNVSRSRLNSGELWSSEMKQFLSNRRRDAQMNWFESPSDWEVELDRCGAGGWRVSSVNDRFEMSTR